MGIRETMMLEQERDALKAANVRLQRQLRDAKAKSVDLVEAVHSAAKDAALIVGKPEPIPRPKRDRRKSPEALLIHTTDWQLGKTVPDGSFNTEVCIRRVKSAIATAIKLAEIQRADHPVRDAHLMLGGDLVEGGGNIFPTQAHEIDSGLKMQLFHASALIESAVLTLLENFERVYVWECHGNHGRIGRKGDYRRDDNADGIVSWNARMRLESQPRLTWREPESWYQIVEIGAYRALLVHGDQVKSFGGNTPAFGLMRKVTAWASGVLPEFRDCYVGHFHQAMTLTLPGKGGRIFMTPSVESGSEYAREFVAAKGMPAQRAHFIDPGKGRVTAEFLIYLEDEGV